MKKCHPVTNEEGLLCDCEERTLRRNMIRKDEDGEKACIARTQCRLETARGELTRKEQQYHQMRYGGLVSLFSCCD